MVVTFLDESSGLGGSSEKEKKRPRAAVERSGRKAYRPRLIANQSPIFRRKVLRQQVCSRPQVEGFPATEASQLMDLRMASCARVSRGATWQLLSYRW